MQTVSGKYVLLGGKDLFGRLKESWGQIVQHIERFKTADLFLISTPMWNYNIPYMLKHYIDLIVQPRYLFAYNEKGQAVGLVQNKKMVVITSSGGQYAGKTEQLNFVEPYLKAIFGLVGITDISFIKAEGMDMGLEKQKQHLESAKTAATELAMSICQETSQ